MQLEAPDAEEYFPAAQLVQSEANDEPASEPYLPARQELQEADSELVEYLPAAQSVQELAPAAEYLPAVQSIVQLTWPVDAWYLPAGQASHDDEPVLPW